MWEVIGWGENSPTLVSGRKTFGTMKDKTIKNRRKKKSCGGMAWGGPRLIPLVHVSRRGSELRTKKKN